MKTIDFLGLGIESGQKRTGLAESSLYAKSHFHRFRELGHKMVDHGRIRGSVHSKRSIHCEQGILAFDWFPYLKAYQAIHLLLRKKRSLVLNWGGDHSVALSTVGAFTSVYPSGKILWIDAHADLNLPSHSPTGNVHGMPLSILLNLEDIQLRHFPWLQKNVSPENLIYLGLRDLDPFEDKMIRSLGIQTYTAKDVRERSMQAVASEILASAQTQDLHISFDIDSVDPCFAPSTGVAVHGGLTIEDLRILGHTLSLHPSLRSLDVVEINPEIGTAAEVHKTYTAAFQLLAPLLTRTIASESKTFLGTDLARIISKDSFYRGCHGASDWRKPS